MVFIRIKNNESIDFESIPVLDYENFLNQNCELLNNINFHCVNYFAVVINDDFRFICCIADDEEHNILVSSANHPKNEIGNYTFKAFSSKLAVFEKFEREIYEKFQINYSNHPWLKPLRSPSLRKVEQEYRFFTIPAEELHEVGVGPIHAGIIEPGHFRFICNGEQIMNLEIQLGYQHRGLESLMLTKKNNLQRILLCESIAGDSVIEHTLAYVNIYESFNKLDISRQTNIERLIALELERIAIHTGDLSALCTDIAYQLGSAVLGRLRTPLINFFQQWCGNRLAKSLIRVKKNNFPLTKELIKVLLDILNNYENDFDLMMDVLSGLPSALARFERTGILKMKIAKEIGMVGMSARASGLKRDIRFSHPFNGIDVLNHQTIIKRHGDVYSRVQIRKEEIRQSVKYIRNLIDMLLSKEEDSNTFENINIKTKNTNTFICSLVEGWRGEVCHCAIIDEKGDFILYKIKDPSFHNWQGLAMAVRNNEISDFPVCNKSFNLSYCGHDL